MRANPLNIAAACWIATALAALIVGTSDAGAVTKLRATTVSNPLDSVSEFRPRIQGDAIVWQQGSVGQRNIAVYDVITGTTTILASASDGIFPLVSGSTLAWVQMVDPDGEVFVEPGPVGNQLTGNALVESEFGIDGVNLIWSEGDDLDQTPSTADDFRRRRARGARIPRVALGAPCDGAGADTASPLKAAWT